MALLVGIVGRVAAPLAICEGIRSRVGIGPGTATIRQPPRA